MVCIVTSLVEKSVSELNKVVVVEEKSISMLVDVATVLKIEVVDIVSYDVWVFEVKVFETTVVTVL